MNDLEKQNELLLDKIPGWKNDGVRNRETKQLCAYLKNEKGFSDYELCSLTSANVIADIYTRWKAQFFNTTGATQ